MWTTNPGLKPDRERDVVLGAVQSLVDVGRTVSSSVRDMLKGWSPHKPLGGKKTQQRYEVVMLDIPLAEQNRTKLYLLSWDPVRWYQRNINNNKHTNCQDDFYHNRKTDDIKLHDF